MNLYPILNRLKIQDRDTGLIAPWDINWAQREYIDEFHNQWNRGKPVRIIVLKARQLGISTATQGMGFGLCFVMPDTQELTVAHEMDSSEHILGMTHRYWDTFDFRDLYTAKYASRKHIEWIETRSSIRVVTAKNTRAGRGRTVRFLHASEVAFWDDAETLMLGLRQTVPNARETAIILESTANGVGNWFYDQWNAAVSNESEYVPLFFPWWRHPQYTGSAANLPAAKPPFNDEEDALRAIIPRHEFEDRIAWRRWGVRNLAGGDIHMFHQEYPATPEESFIASGLNVFPFPHLNACYKREQGRPGRLVRDANTRGGIRFQDDVSGPLTIYRWPSSDTDWGRYMIGGDPTGTIRGDFGCMQVINRRNNEQVAVYRGRLDPLSMAEEMAKLGSYYNNAELVPETTGPGQGTIGRLIQMEYQPIFRSPWADKQPGILSNTYGWNTTFKTKEWAIGHLLKLIVDNDITIHDPATYSEMRDYVTLEGGGYGPASEKGHDDTVMALAIGTVAAAVSSPMSPFGENQVTPLLPKRRATETQALDPDFWDTIIHGGA